LGRTGGRGWKGKRAVKSQFSAVHILVNNAGGPIRRMDRQINWPDTDWSDDLNLKLMGMLRATRLI
jgi:NAD(P)-dependent dehydrogenase (short-subunit alcohol dehydrogenase family)